MHVQCIYNEQVQKNDSGRDPETINFDKERKAVNSIVFMYLLIRIDACPSACYTIYCTLKAILTANIDEMVDGECFPFGGGGSDLAKWRSSLYVTLILCMYVNMPYVQCTHFLYTYTRIYSLFLSICVVMVIERKLINGI